MHVVIVGGGSVGSSIARELLSHGHDVVVVDATAEVIGRSNLRGAQWVVGDACDLQVLQRARAEEADVVLASHDVDFAPHMQALAAEGSRVAVMGFEEFMSAELRAVNGMEVWDLEREVGAFDAPLPRLRIIELDAFDPSRYL